MGLLHSCPWWARWEVVSLQHPPPPARCWAAQGLFVSCFPLSGRRPGTPGAGVAVCLRPTWCVVEFVDGVLGRTLFWKNPGWWAGRREEGVWLHGVVREGLEGGTGHSPQRRWRNGDGPLTRPTCCGLTRPCCLPPLPPPALLPGDLGSGSSGWVSHGCFWSVSPNRGVGW